MFYRKAILRKQLFSSPSRGNPPETRIVYKGIPGLSKQISNTSIFAVTVTSRENSRPFRWFMITAEDPAVDNNIYDFGRKFADVGSLKTLDTDWRSRYSERCQNTVENADNSAKTQVEVRFVVLLLTFIRCAFRTAGRPQRPHVSRCVMEFAVSSIDI